MKTGLKGKTALVTGGGSGLGKSIALALAAEGVNIAIASRNPDIQAIREIKKHGVKCFSLAVDVSHEEQVVGMIDTTVREFGHLDIFVNNAAWAWHEPITQITRQNWDNTIHTNLSAAVFASREVARHMIRRKSGSILIVGSTAQFARSYGEVAYHISKTGLKVLMTSLAVELAPYGIRSNMIVPGHYRTRLTSGCSSEVEKKMMAMIPLRRLGKTEEVGPAAVLLLSDKLSPYTTGTEIVIDGGLSLRPYTLLNDRQILKLNQP